MVITLLQGNTTVVSHLVACRFCRLVFTYPIALVLISTRITGIFNIFTHNSEALKWD